jgi:hypothetical protein
LRKEESVLLFCPEDKESSCLQNFGNNLLDYTEAYSSVFLTCNFQSNVPMLTRSHDMSEDCIWKRGLSRAREWLSGKPKRGGLPAFELGVGPIIVYVAA